MDALKPIETRQGWSKQKVDEYNRYRIQSVLEACLLYTSDAADDLLCVDLGGRRIIKKKNEKTITTTQIQHKAIKSTKTHQHMNHIRQAE